MVDIPTKEPSVIYAGDTVKWTKSLSDYKASDGWTLKYSIKGPIDIDDKIEATADGDDHSITIDAATTATWTKGDYWLHGYVEKASERYTVFKGTIEVKPDLSQESSTYDGRSDVKIMLDNVETAIKSLTQKTSASYSIAGRSYTRKDLSELIKTRDRLKAEYASEQKEEKIARGEDTGGRALVRFTKP